MINLKIITSTTRPGRKGIAIAKWITDLAVSDPGYQAELLDLGAINLPLMDEPNHPRLQQYQHEHTKRWSAKINEADAFIIVLAEYNFSFPAPIKNALDYLYHEWKYKPVSFVSYGGVSGGLRSVQMLKQVVTTLNMVPVLESVTIPMFSNFLDDQDTFNPNELISKSAQVMLQELKTWSDSLKQLREKKKS
ncbi:NAD(P)H-dependent oxidoreductase (plasmid) [Pedobacter sp. BS3]|uniref:NADPH-dependent FMN reductase n=1 Tax=Pedobacter sp. BS3 TaxID=2567937 RepID=UPI0011EEBBA6|nr:NAD(P)H-dependent oxidoreductase [Pedobacter sp. BS3]TZF85833.1 NAD(P)H-dependent oxidoreductase [Pedobacter sp. BS3]